MPIPTPADLDLPYRAWNPEQWETITRLACSEKPYILLEAPTGAGKSGIVKGLANLLDLDCMVLTGTKQLQDQYHETLGFEDVRGRNNFPCLIMPVTADNGQCTIGMQCRHKAITVHLFRPPEPHDGCEPCDTWEQAGSPDRDLCPYYYQRYHGETARYSVLNYAYWLTMSNYTNAFTRKGLTVIDEAHTLEDELRKFSTVSFSRRRTAELGLTPCYADPDDVQAWVSWAAECRKDLSREYFKIQKNLLGPVTNARDETRRKQILSFVRAADLFWVLGPLDWTGELQENTGTVTFKPLWVAGLTQQFVTRHLGEKTIFMSGTILDREIFCQNLGLDPTQVDCIQMPSTFDADRRPFYYTPTLKGSYRDEGHVKKIVEHLDTLIDRHPDEAGMIHTVSYYLAGQILKYSRHTRRMLTHDKHNRAHALTQFRRSSGMIWISPSSMTGVDLPYDLCRWQIVAKIPFPNKGDKQIKKIMQEGPDGRSSLSANRWYTWVTACTLLQAYGRGMRAPDDQCTTYLIDPNWSWFRSAARALLPQWFREAVRKMPPQIDTTTIAPTGSEGQDIQALLKKLGVGGRT